MGRRKDYKPGGKKFVSTKDGFDNITAKLGLGQDNQLAKGGYVPGKSLSSNRTGLDAMYRTSWVVGRMVDVVAEDMLKGNLDIQSEMPPGDIDALLRYMQRMGVQARLTDAIKWSRLYGGALAVILIDGAKPEAPLQLESIKQNSFKGLHVLDRFQVTPSSEVVKDLGPMLSYPKFYEVNDTEGLRRTRFHHSRVLRFVGVELPYQERRKEQHWGASVVERAYDRILALDSATHGSANMMMKAYLRVIGVEGLRSILAAGGDAEKALLKMFDMIRQMQTNEGITLLDAKDVMTTHNWTFAGVYDALQAFSEQIAGATGITLIRLLGQSPKGFSTGEADLRTYYDTVGTQREDDLRPAHEKLLPIMAMSKFGKPLPEGTTFEYPDLWTPTEVDKANIATQDAQAVAGLYSAGLITEGHAMAELRDAGRITGRFTGISDEDVKAANQLSAPAPSLELGSDEPEPAGADEPTPQEVSLNGAQVASMISIVGQVGSNQIPRASGVQMLMASFNLNEQQAEEIMGEVGRGFVPSTEGDVQ